MPNRFAFLLLVVLALSGASAVARAEPAVAPAVSAPVPLAALDVAYPEGARGDATVILTLVVEADGHVRSATAAEPNEPFSSAAERAAQSFVFLPARRGEVAIAARIRVEIVFRAPEPPASPKEEPPAPPPIVTEPGKKPIPVENVTVHGAREEPSRTASLTRAEVRQLPGAFGDPFRAIDALPGVTPIVSGVPFFYIRGAPPGNVGYFIDGIKVPYLFHVALGPSVVHPGIVEKVDLYPGGYPASFGRFTGGIVSGTLAAPRATLHGEANLRLVDAGVLAETGFANGKGTVLVGGRYSYTGALLSLFAKDTEIGYRDYQARVSYELGRRDRIVVTSFGAFDLVAQTTEGIRNVLFGTEFYRLDARWEHDFSERTKARVSATFGYDQTRVPAQPRNSQNTLANVRSELVHVVSDDLRIRLGADALLERFTIDEQPWSDPDDPTTTRFNSLFPARIDLSAGIRADAVLRIGRLEVTPGVRFDLFHSGTSTIPAIDPRTAMRLSVTDSVRLVHAFGLTHQAPAYLIPIPGLAVGNLQGGLQKAVQSSGGIEVDLPFEITASVTGFQNAFYAMSDTLGVGGTDPFDLEYRAPRSDGDAIGLEVYLRRRLTKRLSGYLTYTASRTTRNVDGERFVSAFDRPHVFNAALALDLGRNWRAGARFTFYTGTPVIGEGGQGTLERSLAPVRDPDFYRLDLRVEKRWNIGKTGYLSLVVEMMNAMLRKEVVQGQEIGPVSIPSLGVEGGL